MWRGEEERKEEAVRRVKERGSRERRDAEGRKECRRFAKGDEGNGREGYGPGKKKEGREESGIRNEKK